MFRRACALEKKNSLEAHCTTNFNLEPLILLKLVRFRFSDNASTSETAPYAQILLGENRADSGGSFLFLVGRLLRILAPNSSQLLYAELKWTGVFRGIRNSK